MQTRSWVLAVALALVAFGCSGRTGPQDGATTTTETTDLGFPVTISTPAGDAFIAHRPERIVSLSATATESLFAIGAGPQVIAVDDSSTYPADVPGGNLNGFTATAESVASFDPDLVVYFFDPGDLGDGLDSLGIPALFQPAAVTVADVYAQMEQLGTATGHAADAAEVVTSVQVRIDEVTASVEGRSGLTYYYELDQTLYSLTSATFVGTLFASLGLVNIADAADAEGTGYPQLSAEFILEADPDIMFLADTKCCGQSTGALAKRPGWDQLTAVRTGSVVELDDDVASRWGPRVIDLLSAAAGAITREPVGG